MSIAAADITPTLQDVASHVPTLTRNAGGGMENTFNDNTTPNAAAAQVQVARAARHIALQLGKPDLDPEDPDNEEFVQSATDAVAIYAALLIASSADDDASESHATSVDQLGRLAREQIKAVVATARSNATGGWRINSIKTIDSSRVGAVDLAPLQPPDTDPDLQLLLGQVGNGPDPEL